MAIPKAKYGIIFKEKLSAAILSNSTRLLLWFFLLTLSFIPVHWLVFCIRVDAEEQEEDDDGTTHAIPYLHFECNFVK